MKLYKFKDAGAVFLFIIIIILQYKKYYNLVLVLLTLGMFIDLLVSITNIGDIDII
jgi:hypothetical protein